MYVPHTDWMFAGYLQIMKMLRSNKVGLSTPVFSLNQAIAASQPFAQNLFNK